MNGKRGARKWKARKEEIELRRPRDPLCTLVSNINVILKDNKSREEGAGWGMVEERVGGSYLCRNVIFFRSGTRRRLSSKTSANPSSLLSLPLSWGGDDMASGSSLSPGKGE